MIKIFNQIAVFGLILITAACAASKAPTRPIPTSPSWVQTEPGKAPEPDTSREAYQKGLAYLEQGQFQKAQALFEKLAASNPKQASIYNALGVAYKRQEMLDKAVEAYKRALSLQDRYVEAHYNLGIAYRENGQFQNAETEYNRAITLDPNFALAYYNLGVLYDLYLNQPSEALKQYKEYRRLAGGNEALNVWIEDLEQRLQTPTATGVAQPKGDPK